MVNPQINSENIKKMEQESLQEYVKIISDRNSKMLDKSWKEDNYFKPVNNVYLRGENIPFEFLGFHVGDPNQNKLIPGGVNEDLKELNLGHVFFSTTIKDLEYYLEGKENKRMVYFADFREVYEARVQKNYSSRAIFLDDVLKTFSSYKKGEKTKEDIERSLDFWLKRNTGNFDKNNIDLYKKNNDYILLKAPIKVLR